MSWKISKIVAIGLLISVVTGYASSYFFKTDTDTSFLIGLIGAVISLLLELLNNVEKIVIKLPKLEVLFLLEEIYGIHPVLWERTQKIIKEIHSERRIEDRESSIQALLSKLIGSATIQVLAVHLVKNLEDITAWKSPQLLDYYRANQKAAKRIKVRRIFILFKNELLSNQSPLLDSKVLEIMKEQKDFQIDVRVAWNDLVPANLCSDYLVVDRNIIKSGFPTGGYNNWMEVNQISSISFSAPQAQEYIDKFHELVQYSEPLEAWIKENESYLTA